MIKKRENKMSKKIQTAMQGASVYVEVTSVSTQIIKSKEFKPENVLRVISSMVAMLADHGVPVDVTFAAARQMVDSGAIVSADESKDDIYKKAKELHKEASKIKK